jgi:hypothetical protein
MRIFPIGIEYPLDAVVHRPQHPDARVQQRATVFRGHDQRLYGGLPMGQLLFCLRWRLDVIGGILERHEAGDGVFEARGPAQCRQPSLSTSVFTPSGIRGSFIGPIAGRARHAGAAASASVHPFPRSIGMIFAYPALVVAEQATHQSCFDEALIELFASLDFRRRNGRNNLSGHPD